MALQWYYRVMGQEAGPVSSSELRELAASGFLAPDVDVRKGAEGAWIPAGQVKGLFERPSRMLLGEEVDGPVDRAPSAPGPARASDRSGSADEPVAEPPPSEPQGADIAWYCQTMGREIGPLSLPAIKELAAAGFLSPEVLVRKGRDGDWTAANEVAGLLDDEPQTTPAGEDVKRSPPPAPESPARDASPPPAAPSGAVQIPDDDGLFALVKERTAEPPSPTPQAAAVSWYYQAMGEELGPVSLAELKELAETGFVTPEVLVRPDGDGRWVPASQVKGLYDGGSQPAEAEKPQAVSEPEGVGLAPLPEADRRRPAAERPRKLTPRPPAAETRWYYEVEGQAQGPLTAAELKERAKSGQLAPHHLIRTGEEGNWVPAGQVKGLFPKAGPSPPSPRPPAGKQDPARSLRCPGCGRQYKVWGEMATKAMKCTCGALLRPAAQGPAAPAQRAAPSSGSLLDAAFDELRPAGAAPPDPAASSLGSFLDEALDEPLPASGTPGALPPPSAPPRAKPAPVPRRAASPFGREPSRPRRGRAPGMVSRVIVGGFMTFVGAVGAMLFLAMIAVMVMALLFRGSQLAGVVSQASSQGGAFFWLEILIRLAVFVMVGFASFYYVAGGIGILRGEADGAERGVAATTMSLTIVGITTVWAILSVLAMANKTEAPSAKVAGAITAVLFFAFFQSVIPAALLFWCSKYGPRLPH
ncbi:MAG TPA: GYF domain-containing protein [Thermoguttaceae bacterium]|nr:GYF domain-containing protein [Thermoguttaceae bacterium]